MSQRAGDPLRLFAAVRCPASPGLRRVLAALEAWRPAVKPVAPADLHLTLRFLGDTPADRVSAVAGAIDEAVAAAGVGAFELRWDHLGRFPTDTRKPPRVIHVSPANPEPMERLAAEINRTLGEMDPPIPPEPRPFAAHLTLARLKPTGGGRRGRSHRSGISPGQIDALFREHAHADLGGCRVTAVQLIASELTPAGPIHRIQHEARL